MRFCSGEIGALLTMEGRISRHASVQLFEDMQPLFPHPSQPKPLSASRVGSELLQPGRIRETSTHGCGNRAAGNLREQPPVAPISYDLTTKPRGDDWQPPRLCFELR